MINTINTLGIKDLNDSLEADYNRDIKIRQQIINFIENGNERGLISLGQSLVNSNEVVSVEEYILMLCDSKYQVVAAMTVNSMHHEKRESLKELVLKNINTENYSLFDNVITLLYLNKEDKLYNILNALDDSQEVSNVFKKAISFLISGSQYEFVFTLLYEVAKSRHSLILKDSLYNFKINEFYVNRYAEIIQKTAQELFYKGEYDGLFKLCKNLDILMHLRGILDLSSEELINKFLSQPGIDGIRLAFRVIESNSSSEEEAYIKILSRIAKLHQTEEVKYMYFFYMLKIITLEKNVRQEIEEQLHKLGPVDLLLQRNHGKKVLARAMEEVLFESGMDAYNNFIKAIGENNIFKSLINNANFNYRSEKIERIRRRKEYIEYLIEEGWSERDLIEFYFTSFYKYLLSFQEFLGTIYKGWEDRISLYNLCSKYLLIGRVRNLNRDKEFAIANCQSVTFKNSITLNENYVGKNKVALLKEGDEFSFKLKRFNPITGTIIISNFKILDEERKKVFKGKDLSNWEYLKELLNIIISNKFLNEEIRVKVGDIPRINFKRLNLVAEYIEIFSDVLLALKDSAYDIICLLNSLEKSGNNIFSIKAKDIFIPINRDEKLLEKSYSLFNCILSQVIHRDDLIWLYVNSHLRMIVNIQLLLDSLVKDGEEFLDLDSNFYKYNFYGQLSGIINKNYFGIEYPFVRTKSIKSINAMSFRLDKEKGITKEAIENNALVTFRLRKYFVKNSNIAIEDLRTIEPKYLENLSDWKVLHNCNKLFRYRGRVFKENLREIESLGKLNENRVEYKRFYNDFLWIMENLCSNEKDLFLYLKALGKNNPYYYKVGYYNKSFWAVEEEVKKINGSTIIENLIINDYSLYEIIYIYLNSFLCDKIPIQEVIKEYYGKNNLKSEYGMNYFTRKVASIEFLGSVINVCNGIVRVYFKQTRCSCRVYLRLENSGYEKEYFTVDKEIIVSLAEYDHVNNIIYVELTE